MEPTRRCLQCSSERFYVIDEVTQPNFEDSQGIRALVAVTTTVPATQLGVASGNAYRSWAGTFEAWVCADCSRTELYVRDPRSILERLSKIPKSGVRFVSGAQPYR